MRGSTLGRIAALTLVGTLAWIGCSDRELLTGPPAGPQLQIQGSRPEIGVAIAAQERHNATLLDLPGVVGTAVAILPNGRIGVRIFVEYAGVRNLPSVIDGVPAAVEVTGRFMARSDPTTRQRPAPVGFSIGHPDITAGTIGARVRDASGNLFVLSNNHVLANQNDALIGDPEFQPGPFDGGTAADQVGTLAAFNPITFTTSASNMMDAALAATNASNVGNSTPADDGYGMPNSVIYGDANNDGTFDNVSALLGLNVQKYGRTTKLTHGQITGVNATVTVCYEVLSIFCIKSARFVNQLIITPGAFSGGGDSGSLIVSDDGNKNPVALLFAGSATQTIANRIDLVLNHFGVTVDGSAPPPVTDLATIGVSAPGAVDVGNTVVVTVTVQNVGTQDVTQAFGVALLDQTDHVVIGAQPVAGLAAGATATLTFSWNTTGRSIGSHTLRGFHGLADGSAGNNQATTTIEVTGSLTDVAVIGVSAPATVAVGSTVDVTVTVRNVGNQDVTTPFGVALLDQTDNIVIGAQPVAGLAVGATATLTFSWNTTGRSIGSHTLLSFHGLSDGVGANNQASTTVALSGPLTDIGVISVGAPGSVTVGNTVDVVVTVRNVGNQNVAGTFGVALVDQTDNVVIGAQPVAGLAVGATATLTFSWNTTGRSVGSHTLAGFHGFADGNGANNVATTTIAVTAPGVALHVGNLESLANSGGTSWSASVDITIHDANHQPLNGVHILGAWNPAGLASDECVTGDLGGNGTCFVLFPFVPNSQASVTFTVNSATLAGFVYQPGANHDPDGGSNGTAITVNRPF